MPDYTDVPISSFPDAQSVDASDKVTGLKSGNNTNFSFNSILAWLIIQFYAVFLPVSSKGAAGGVASLDSTGIVPDDQLPPIPSQPSDIGAQDEITASGILKGDGQGGVSAATAGTDYQAPLTAGTDYQTPLTAGTDYVTPAQLEGKANQAQLATVETGSTASRTYAVGEYFCWNGLLYRVTSAISSGGTFTPGTNCEQTTVGDEIQKKAIFSTTSSSPAVLSFGPNTRAIIFATSTNAGGRGIFSTSTNTSSAASVSALVPGNAITMTSSGSTITVSSSTNVVYEILMLAGDLPTIS